MNVQDLALLLSFIFSFKEINGATNEDRLTRSLLDESRYSPGHRPVINESDPIVVHHGAYLRTILDVDEKNMIITINVHVKMWWKDEYLVWNASDYGGLKKINLEADVVWTPPIIMYNKAESSFEYFKPLVIVRHDGIVTWFIPMVFKSSCFIHVSRFPFDEQVCEIIFGSWNYDISKLDIYSLKDKMFHSNLTNGEWELKDTKAVKTQLSHICCERKVARITYKIYITRRILFYLVNFVLPCVIVAFLTLLVCLTPVESGERMAVGVTILLAMAVFFLMLEATMPSSSEVPLLAKYYCVTVVEVCCCLLSMCWILRFVHHNSEPLPNWIKKGILKHLARFVFYKTGLTLSPRKIEVKERTATTANREHELAKKYTAKWKKRIKMKRNQVQTKISPEDDKALDILVDKVREDARTEKLKEKWATAANVLNRFFTGLFIFAAVLTIIAIFIIELEVNQTLKT